MKTLIASLALLITVNAQAGNFDCHAEQSLVCGDEGCRMEPNISTALTLRGRRAELATYSVVLKGTTTWSKGADGEADGFLVRARGETVNGEPVRLLATGAIEASGAFRAVIGGEIVTGSCVRR